MKSVILAIDPGYLRSAWVEVDADSRCLLDFGIDDNDAVVLRAMRILLYWLAASAALTAGLVLLGGLGRALHHWRSPEERSRRARLHQVDAYARERHRQAEAAAVRRARGAL